MVGAENLGPLGFYLPDAYLFTAIPVAEPVDALSSLGPHGLRLHSVMWQRANVCLKAKSVRPLKRLLPGASSTMAGCSIASSPSKPGPAPPVEPAAPPPQLLDGEGREEEKG